MCRRGERGAAIEKNNRKGNRRSIRLKGYDYTRPGAYFVTICTYQRECILGGINNDIMALSVFGEIVKNSWDDLPNHYPDILLDSFIVMPNHIHGIINLLENHTVRAGLKPAPLQAHYVKRAGYKPAPTGRHGLSEIVRAFKTFSSIRINHLRNTPGFPVWQRNYYEHIIRGKADFHNIREYIISNPMNWERDEENPARLAKIQ